MASLSTNDAGQPISSVVAVDPESGEVKKVFDGFRAGCGFLPMGVTRRSFPANGGRICLLRADATVLVDSLPRR